MCETHPSSPPPPLPLALIIFRYAKVRYLWQRMQTFLPKVYMESQSLDWACLRLTRFCLSWKSADKEMWIHLKGKMRGISFPENRKFKVASPAADASWGVGDGKEEEGWFLACLSSLAWDLFLPFLQPSVSGKDKEKAPKHEKRASSYCFGIWFLSHLEFLKSPSRLGIQFYEYLLNNREMIILASSCCCFV